MLAAIATRAILFVVFTVRAQDVIRLVRSAGLSSEEEGRFLRIIQMPRVPKASARFLLQEAVLVHEESEDFKRLGAEARSGQPRKAGPTKLRER